MEPSAHARGGVVSWAPALLAGAIGLSVYLTTVLGPYLADVSWRRALSDPARAGAHLDRAIRLNPFQPAYHARVSELVAGSPTGPLEPLRFAMAAGHLQEARRLDPAGSRWALQQARLMRRGYFDLFGDRSSLRAALRAYEEAERLGPIDPFAAFERATLAAAAGEIETARDAFHRATQIEPNFLNARLLNAKLELEAGETDEARTALAEAERRRAAVSEYLPANPYETSILAWDERLARQLREETGRPSGVPAPEEGGNGSAYLAGLIER